MTAMPVVNGKSSISGYSGAAVKPIALRFCTQVQQDEEIHKLVKEKGFDFGYGHEMSGIGGIETWRDAAEFLAVGCRTVQVTTAIMQYGYRIVEDMISGLSHFMDERGFRLSIMKFSIPEKSIAVRLQTTTSHPVSLSTSRRRPSLSRKTVELVRLYFR